MSVRKPLVLDDSGGTQQLQSQDRLRVDQRLDELEDKLRKLTLTLIDQNIEVPDELTADL